MRPVPGADLHRVQSIRAELVSGCGCDGVLRDVLIYRVIFERINNAGGGLRESTREDPLAPLPHTRGRHHIAIPIARHDADLLRKQTPIQQMRSEDRNKLIANVDLL